jgi:hypothetical protein
MNNFTEAVQSKTSAELLKMVYEFDEWGPEMPDAVEQQLSTREILPEDLTIYKKEKIETENSALTQGQEASLFGQITGWLTVFGFFGIAIGYNYAFAKLKGRYSGKEYFKYNEQSRKNGKNLFYASLLLTSLAVLYRIISRSGTNL